MHLFTEYWQNINDYYDKQQLGFYTDKYTVLKMDRDTNIWSDCCKDKIELNKKVKDEKSSIYTNERYTQFTVVAVKDVNADADAKDFVFKM